MDQGASSNFEQLPPLGVDTQLAWYSCRLNWRLAKIVGLLKSLCSCI